MRKAISTYIVLSLMFLTYPIGGTTKASIDTTETQNKFWLLLLSSGPSIPVNGFTKDCTVGFNLGSSIERLWTDKGVSIGCAIDWNQFNTESDNIVGYDATVVTNIFVKYIFAGQIKPSPQVYYCKVGLLVGAARSSLTVSRYGVECRTPIHLGMEIGAGVWPVSLFHIDNIFFEIAHATLFTTSENREVEIETPGGAKSKTIKSSESDTKWIAVRIGIIYAF